MTPSPGSSGLNASAAPLPPLPDLSAASGTGGSGGQQDVLASLMSGIAPVKSAVDQILQATKSVVQSGVVPGAEQVCSQINALAVSLLPMAVQSGMQPDGGQPMPPGPPPPMGPGQ